MEYAISHVQTKSTYQAIAKRKSLIARFFQWAANQDEANHVGWVGASVTVIAGVFFPLTMAVVLLNGAVFGLIIAAMVSLALVVITNLAAISTKYTIPFFFFGILIDLGVIVASFFVK